MTRRLSSLLVIAIVAGFAADSYAVSTFSQNFESDTLGSAAGWTAGTRDSTHFDVSGTPGTDRPTIGVTNTDSVSPQQSIEVVGVSNGNSMHAWRDYGGFSSNGVDPITVKFDFKIVSLENPNFVEFHPFVFNTSLFGSAGTAHPDVWGWPVAIRVLNSGFIDYAAEGGNIELLPVGTYTQGDWARVTATIFGSQDVDLSVTVLTGTNSGASGGISGGPFQVSTPASYYDNALDELRGIGFATLDDNTAGFFHHDAVRIDNFSVTIGVVPEPASGMLMGLGAIALFQLRRRRRTH